MQTVVEYLRNWRSGNGLTQEQAADKVGTSQSTYNKWESGRKQVPLKHYAEIARIIGLRLSDLTADTLKVEVRDEANPSESLQLNVKDFLRVLEENNGLLKVRCERLEEEVRSLKAELQQYRAL